MNDQVDTTQPAEDLSSPADGSDQPEMQPSPSSSRKRRHPLSMGRRSIYFFVLVIITGAVAGLVWHLIVKVPSYLTIEDGTMLMADKMMETIAIIDLVFTVIGLLVGLSVGLLAWVWFARLGWKVTAIAVLGSLLAGATCWAVGVLLGPRNFADRVAAAVPGDQVPLDFNLHTMAVFLVWALGAVIPIMLYANLSRREAGYRARIDLQRAER